jgi:hypothetical protein
MTEVQPVLGIKETKEVLVAINEVAIVLAKHLKDGAQLTDAIAIVDDFKNNPDLLAKLLAAKENISAVPAELKDVSLVEGVELAITQASYAPKIIAALKKDA